MTKTRFLFLIFLIVLIRMNLIGQTVDTTCKFRQIIKKYNVEIILKTNILPPVISAIDNRFSFSLIWEFNFGLEPKMSQQLEWINSQSQNELSDQIICDLKYFLSPKKNHTGFFTGIYFKGINYYYTRETNAQNPQIYTYLKYNKESFGSGFLIGYQYNINRRFVIELNVGFGFLYNTKIDVIKAINIEPEDFDNIYSDKKIGLNIGYKF